MSHCNPAETSLPLTAVRVGGRFRNHMTNLLQGTDNEAEAGIGTTATLEHRTRV